MVRVSAIIGENVATRPEPGWYYGPTFLELLSGWRPRPGDRHAARDSPSSTSSARTGSGDRLARSSGAYCASVTRCRRRQGRGHRRRPAARPLWRPRPREPGTPVTVVLRDDIDIRRGDCSAGGCRLPSTETALTATVDWTGADPLDVGAGYLLLAGPRAVPAEVTALHARLDVRPAGQTPNTLSSNESATST